MVAMSTAMLITAGVQAGTQAYAGHKTRSMAKKENAKQTKLLDEAKTEAENEKKANIKKLRSSLTGSYKTNYSTGGGGSNNGATSLTGMGTETLG